MKYVDKADYYYVLKNSKDEYFIRFTKNDMEVTSNISSGAIFPWNTEELAIKFQNNNELQLKDFKVVQIKHLIIVEYSEV